jgi:hypothetical protein
MYRLAKVCDLSTAAHEERLLNEFIAGRELAAALAPGAAYLVLESHSEYDDEGGYYNSLDGVDFYDAEGKRLYPFGDEPREQVVAAWDRLMALYGHDDKLTEDDDAVECLQDFLSDNYIFGEAFGHENGWRVDLLKAPRKPTELYVLDQAA